MNFAGNASNHEESTGKVNVIMLAVLIVMLD